MNLDKTQTLNPNMFDDKLMLTNKLQEIDKQLSDSYNDMHKLIKLQSNLYKEKQQLQQKLINIKEQEKMIGFINGKNSGWICTDLWNSYRVHFIEFMSDNEIIVKDEENDTEMIEVVRANRFNPIYFR